MYDGLVKSLRVCGRMTNIDDNCISYVNGCCEAFPDCAYALMDQAADAIEELQQTAEHYHGCMNEWFEAVQEYKAAVPKWIPVTERLPEDEEAVFVVRKFLGVKGQVPPSTYTEVAYRIDDRWVADSDEYKIARHRHTDPLFWMPLPEPPKEGE